MPRTGGQADFSFSSMDKNEAHVEADVNLSAMHWRFLSLCIGPEKSVAGVLISPII
jgi:hypothetical protein